ncbi:MAG: T9SS type A sorting domain-containing protein [candidate division Zixibacteria bacterium]|nr:T9SS type A sorting domain-containing protein [candidate division Zixibacteria bacterium]
MLRNMLIIIIVLLVALAYTDSFAELSKTMPMTKHKHIKGDEPLPQTNHYPYNPGMITDSPGDIVGYTYYDYQTNGSSGDRMALVEDGSKMFAWMMLPGWPYPGTPRHVYYNWADPDGIYSWPEEGFQVSETAGSGYTNVDLYENRSAIAYHQGNNVIISMEWDPPGMGFFTHYNVPNQLFPQTPDSPGLCFWPYLTVDRNDNIHMMMTENTNLRMQRMGYTRSEDGGENWTNFTFVDTVMVISSVLDASPVSDRVVVAYAKTQDTTTQLYNDIVYYSSVDGTTWDWRYGMINVTNYGTDDDSLWAYTDVDVIIDYNDYMHLIWNANWVTDEGVYFRTFLFHYSEETGEITEITAKPDSLWTNISGAWNRPICKMNLGIQEASGAIFATWTQFDTSDVSAGGFGNGDIFKSYSDDGGAWWANPVNMTCSHTPGCYPGECDSDHWSTLADVVEGTSPEWEAQLHLFYTNDKDAGGIPQDEGVATENPMRYFHYITTDIPEDDNRPVNFSLNQNYPNPFNAGTVISFNLKADSDVIIDIYDITGARVTTLVDGQMPAGNHEITWDAADVASGVYYYKLTAGDESEARQAVLIK